MPTGKPNRRKTDQSPPDKAALAEAGLLRLSSEVNRACTAWLLARGLPLGRQALEYGNGTRTTDSSPATGATGGNVGESGGIPPAVPPNLKKHEKNTASGGACARERIWRISPHQKSPHTKTRK